MGTLTQHTASLRLARRLFLAVGFSAEPVRDCGNCQFLQEIVIVLTVKTKSELRKVWRFKYIYAVLMSLLVLFCQLLFYLRQT